MIRNKDLPDWLKPKKQRTIVQRWPKEFVEVINMRTGLEGHRNRNEYLEKPTKQLKPTVNELTAEYLYSMNNDIQTMKQDISQIKTRQETQILKPQNTTNGKK